MSEEGVTYPPNLPVRMERLLRIFDGISIWTGKAFAWLVVPLVCALVYEVISRYFFNAPTQWAYDTTYMLYGAHFMLVAAFGLAKHDHIRTDFIYRLLPVRGQATIDAILYLLLYLPALVVFLWVSTEFAYVSWMQGERSNLSPWLPPIYPLKTALPVSAALLLVQGVSEFLKSVYAARGGKWE
jgi:TRAP-type mannitol/chloroaromatic compound transport system permease small subunit